MPLLWTMKNSSVTSTFTLSRNGWTGGSAGDVAGLAGGAARMMSAPAANATKPSRYLYLRRFIKTPDESLLLHDPDVAIENRVAVALKVERAGLHIFVGLLLLAATGRSVNLEVILNHHAVLPGG